LSPRSIKRTASRLNSAVNRCLSIQHLRGCPHSQVSVEGGPIQNFVPVHLNEAQWTDVDGLLEGLERALAPQLVSLSTLERRRLMKMGDHSGAFCRRARMAMRGGQAQLPRSIDLDEMHRGLVTHDALAKRHARMSRPMERVVDTDIALGSDAMCGARQVCGAQAHRWAGWHARAAA
jgi:hypothetical protein